jgi:cobalt-zinc-cadmium efflux system membrane fusion protein
MEAHEGEMVGACARSGGCPGEALEGEGHETIYGCAGGKLGHDDASHECAKHDGKCQCTHRSSGVSSDEECHGAGGDEKEPSDHKCYGGSGHDAEPPGADHHDERALGDEPVDEDDHEGHDHAAHDVAAMGEDSHAGHDHAAHDEGARIVLSERDRNDAGIRLAQAGPGHLDLTTRLLGEVCVNGERLAHVVPPVSGVVRDVHVSIGDDVSAGDLLAVIASRELAEARGQFLNARGRRELALIEFERQEELWKREIMAEQDYLDAKQALLEADIELQTAEQTLHALGVEDEELARLTMTHEPGALTRLELRAPISGTIIEMHMVRGEVVGEDSDVLLIADLSTAWIDLDVPQADLSAVYEGQPVTISASTIGIPDATGVVSFVAPIIDEETRTALARIEISNETGEWRPGLFVTADVSFDRLEVSLLVPKDAVQSLEGEPVVFVPEEGGFESVPVTLGHSTSTHTEIVSGLSQGQEYVIEGAYALKAEIVTSGLDSHAGHGH